MSKKKNIWLLCVVGLSILLVYGLVISTHGVDKLQKNNDTIEKISVTDSKGRKVIIDEPPVRIVSIGSGLEALLALGLRNEIVAVSGYSKNRKDYQLLLPDVPDVGGSNKPNIEKVLAVNPDMVLGYAIYNYSEMEPVLDARKIPLVQLDFFIPEKYEREVEILGKLLHKEKRAQELIDFEKKHLSFITDRVKNIKTEEKIRVYTESYQSYQVEIQHEVSRDASIGCGGINIFSDAPFKNSIVSSESVVEKNPDVIIKLINIQNCTSGYGISDTTAVESIRNEIMSRPGWQQINAVKNGKVYIISSDTKGIHPSVYYSYVAKWLYPVIFQDLDPSRIHQTWYKQFLEIDLQGVYTYPENITHTQIKQ